VNCKSQIMRELQSVEMYELMRGDREGKSGAFVAIDAGLYNCYCETRQFLLSKGKTKSYKRCCKAVL